MGHSATTTYSLKQTTTKFNAHAHKYTPEQIGAITHDLGDMLHFFGYTDTKSDNETAFFAPSATLNSGIAEQQRLYYGFKDANQAALEKVSSTASSYTPVDYGIYSHPDVF